MSAGPGRTVRWPGLGLPYAQHAASNVMSSPQYVSQGSSQVGYQHQGHFAPHGAPVYHAQAVAEVVHQPTAWRSGLQLASASAPAEYSSSLIVLKADWRSSNFEPDRKMVARDVRAGVGGGPGVGVPYFTTLGPNPRNRICKLYEILASF